MTKPIETDAKGIPLTSSYDKMPPVIFFYSAITLVFGVIGFVIAYFSSYYSESQRANADAKISILASYDLGWMYLGIFLVKLLQLPLAMILGTARKASKAGLPDQHVYKVMGAEGSKLGYVLMENEGKHGVFNRAQRALMNYHENFPSLALQYVAASWVFPFEAFVCLMIWAVSCVVSAVGYTGTPDGRMKGRLPGYFSASALQGMVLIAAVKALP